MRSGAAQVWVAGQSSVPFVTSQQGRSGSAPKVMAKAGMGIVPVQRGLVLSRQQVGSAALQITRQLPGTCCAIPFISPFGVISVV